MQHDDEEDDDRPIGRILTRRELLALLGGAGAVALAGTGLSMAQSGQLSTYLPFALKAGDGTTTPTATGTAGSTPSATVSATGTTGATATESATNTPGATPTATATGQPSATATATAQPSVTATRTATATVTRTPTAVATATNTPIPACVVRPEQTEGPYFVDDQLNRSDIRTDSTTGQVSDGVPLDLTFRVSQVTSNACNALAGATVDVWHCDAYGVYSGVGGNGGDFLRGYQVTDGAGVAQFTTIYPGWYPGRTVHIHFKIRALTSGGQSYDFTAQLYFDDNLTDQVYLLPPYNERGPRTTRNNQDGIYQNGGSQLLLTVTSSGNGYATTFDIGLVL